MKKKIWLFQIPVVLIFLSFFGVTELGVRGSLDSTFFREKLFPVLSRPAHVFSDLKFLVRGPQKPKNKIVVLEIDSPALERLGRWPWHRDIMAYVIEKTFSLGAKVIGLDMVFSEPDRRVPEQLTEILQQKQLGGLISQFETDGQLGEVIRAYGDRLVVGWTSDLACQPYYELPQFCPVQDPEALRQFTPEFGGFSISDFQTQAPFDPSKTPLISFVTPILNIPEYTTAAKHMGFFNAILDSDGYIRRSNLFVMANGKPYPSLALEMAAAGRGQKVQIVLDKNQRLQSLGWSPSGEKIAVTSLGALQINFRGPTSVFPHISVEDVVSEKDVIEDSSNPEWNGRSKKELLQDAYVLIGVTAVGVFDMRHFPFEANAAGVYGHANILENLLSGDPISPGSESLGTIGILILMTMGALAFAFAIESMDAVPALIFTLLTMTLLWVLDFKVLFVRNLDWNTVYLYLELGMIFVLTLAAKYVLEERNKKFIRGAFSKYVSADVVDSILKDPSKLSLGGEKREMTILFSDIRGFTTFSEKMDAKVLGAFLNDYFNIMTQVILENQGTLDKFIGDAVMAFWGAPLNQPLHALNACKAAVEMLRAIEKNRERFKSLYGVDVAMGIGLNSGIVNVGNMGSEQNFAYTVIGDHVNLASRVEGLTKHYGVGVLTTRSTLDCVTNSGQQRLPHRVLDEVKVKGKKQAVELVELTHQEYSQEAMALFQEGRKLYKAKRWQEAIAQFELAKRQFALTQGSKSSSAIADMPCEIYLERCSFFQENPPPEDWDGSWEMDSK